MEVENGNPSSKSSNTQFCNKITLEKALHDGRELMILFINNHFEEAVANCEEHAHESMIHALGRGAGALFQGVLTLDKTYLKDAIKHLKYSADFSSSLRKKSSYAGYFFRTNYSKYSDEECHAELIYAESLLTLGLVTVLDDQTLYGFVNGALKIRASHQSYKECLNILKYKDNWDSEICKMHFESGARLGIGAFDLVISLFPNKLAKLLEFVGFSSDRQVALEELTKSVDLVDGIFYDVTSIILSVYYGFLEFFYGLGESNVVYFNGQRDVWLKRTPDSAIVMLGLGCREMIMGNPDEAINHLSNCVAIKNTLLCQLHYACHWKMMWCNAMKCDWKKAAKLAKLLKEECKWSPAMFTYLYATFLFMVMEEDERPDLREEISENLKKIPQLKRRLGGKRAFHEKIVVERSKKYHEQVEQFILPPFELLYIWNIFNMMSGKDELLQPYMQRIENKLNLHKNDIDSDDCPLDSYCNLTFMKGVIFKNLGFPLQAIECYNLVLSSKKRINVETHLLPQSCFEMGLINWKMNQISEAKRWLKKARDEYSGYLTETMIHFRVQTALNALKKDD